MVIAGMEAERMAQRAQPHALGWEAELPAMEESGREMVEGRAMGVMMVEVDEERGAQRGQPHCTAWVDEERDESGRMLLVGRTERRAEVEGRASIFSD